jgi:hypothetical protein
LIHRSAPTGRLLPGLKLKAGEIYRYFYRYISGAARAAPRRTFNMSDINRAGLNAPRLPDSVSSRLTKGRYHTITNSGILLFRGRANDAVLKASLAAEHPSVEVREPRSFAWVKLAQPELSAPHHFAVDFPERETTVLSITMTSREEGVNPLTGKKYRSLTIRELNALQESAANDDAYVLATSPYYPKLQLSLDLDHGLIAVRDADRHIRVSIFAQNLRASPDLYRTLEWQITDLGRLLPRHFSPNGAALMKNAIETINAAPSQRIIPAIQN